MRPRGRRRDHGAPCRAPGLQAVPASGAPRSLRLHAGVWQCGTRVRSVPRPLSAKAPLARRRAPRGPQGASAERCPSESRATRHGAPRLRDLSAPAGPRARRRPKLAQLCQRPRRKRRLMSTNHRFLVIPSPAHRPVHRPAASRRVSGLRPPGAEPRRPRASRRPEPPFGKSNSSVHDSHWVQQPWLGGNPQVPHWGQAPHPTLRYHPTTDAAPLPSQPAPSPPQPASGLVLRLRSARPHAGNRRATEPPRPNLPPDAPHLLLGRSETPSPSVRPPRAPGPPCWQPGPRQPETHPTTSQRLPDTRLSSWSDIAQVPLQATAPSWLSPRASRPTPRASRAGHSYRRRGPGRGRANRGCSSNPPRRHRRVLRWPAHRSGHVQLLQEPSRAHEVGRECRRGLGPRLSWLPSSRLRSQVPRDQGNRTGPPDPDLKPWPKPGTWRPQATLRRRRPPTPRRACARMPPTTNSPVRP